MTAPLWPILIILALPLLAWSIPGAIWLHRQWRKAMDCFALAFGGVPVSTNQKQSPFTPEAMEKASNAVERYCAELDLTNADHIALWLETNTEEPRIAWLAVQIAEAFDRAISRKHVSWGPGDPKCPPEIKASNGELHTLRCKVCGQDISRAGEICFGEARHD